MGSQIVARTLPTWFVKVRRFVLNWGSSPVTFTLLAPGVGRTPRTTAAGSTRLTTDISVGLQPRATAVCSRPASLAPGPWCRRGGGISPSDCAPPPLLLLMFANERFANEKEGSVAVGVAGCGVGVCCGCVAWVCQWCRRGVSGVGCRVWCVVLVCGVGVWGVVCGVRCGVCVCV